ncbi:hypothetical protein H5410_046981 [Solanum commersonii]|uniref:DUF4283 domain-containing protein n=1 Tax=Solanum commersonii TaxID=4109 RepID=A0A9J5XDU1_SOLCO|nr:hypothetical protein H5410_046981 [Solanum commersonii]
MLKLEEETSTTIAWISLTSIPPKKIWKKRSFLPSSSSGEAIIGDMATRKQTMPSCARVKVELDLLREFPRCIKIGIRGGEVE